MLFIRLPKPQPNSQRAEQESIIQSLATFCCFVLDYETPSDFQWIEKVLGSVKQTSVSVEIVGAASSDVNEKLIVELLDRGVSQVVTSSAEVFNSLVESSEGGIVPQYRLALRFNADAKQELIIRDGKVKTVFCREQEDLQQASEGIFTVIEVKTPEEAAGFIREGGAALLSMPTTTQGLEELVEGGFTSTLHSDRPDALIPTVVGDELGTTLGLVYSSGASIKKAIMTRTGCYQSRKRKEIWQKGESSGNHQQLINIEVDCDRDSLKFNVRQSGGGFCHYSGCYTCYNHNSRNNRYNHCNGPKGLEVLLNVRKSMATGEAPQDGGGPPQKQSYTFRLFSDPKLLSGKIIEEAHELAFSSDADSVKWEAADVIFFALVKCISSGLSFHDVYSELAFRHGKISRRPGLAKLPPLQVGVKPEELAVSGLPKVRVCHLTPQTRNSVEYARLLERPRIDSDRLAAAVQPIIKRVRREGDAALLEYTLQFDKVRPSHLFITAPFPKGLYAGLPEKTIRAIDQAYKNIYFFHSQQQAAALEVETMPGVLCRRLPRPVERVGLYVPGGTAVLPSTALMLGVPAQVAGCSEIIIATPPRPDGSLAPEIAYIASKVGAAAVLLAGGAQAIVALAYGTETVPSVDKICGPGNQYVTAAKLAVQSDLAAKVAVDMPAGPSELVVIADAFSDPAWVAADLLSQAEHGPDSQVVLAGVRLSDKYLDCLQQELAIQAAKLPRRDIVRQSLAKSFVVNCESVGEAIKFSNDYAPEHLILNVHEEEPHSLVDMVQNAGSIFVGKYASESCGDYASGTNHTLPTYGYARVHSGVSVDTFCKFITSQSLTAEGLRLLAPTVEHLADIEGLDAHRNAVSIRLLDGGGNLGDITMV